MLQPSRIYLPGYTLDAKLIPGNFKLDGNQGFGDLHLRSDTRTERIRGVIGSDCER